MGLETLKNFMSDFEEEDEKFLIFEDLYNKGFYVTDGSKFGADFAVYNGKKSS